MLLANIHYRQQKPESLEARFEDLARPAGSWILSNCAVVINGNIAAEKENKMSLKKSDVKKLAADLFNHS
jgi:hypothetical protein